MSDTETLLRSFAAGEITPEAYGRLDLARYQTGLALCHNFITLPHGPIANRPGFEYVLESKYSDKQSRVIPYVYSATEAFMVEVGHLYMRFHALGGTLVEAAKAVTAVSQANPCVITAAAHGYSNGDTVLLGAIDGMPKLTGRWVKVAGAAANTFQITDLAGLPIDSSAMPSYLGGGGVSRVYEITTPYDSTVIDQLDIHFAQKEGTLTLAHPNYATRELVRTGATTWALNTPTWGTSIAAPTGVAAANSGAGAITYTYAVTAVNGAGEESLASATASCTNALYTAGNFNQVTWNPVVGAVRYNVYKLRGGVPSYIGQASTTSFVDDNITPDTTAVPPEFTDPFAGADNYPATVGYFDQRRALARTNNARQKAWLTRTGTDSNLTSSIPVRDNDSISFRIASQAADEIRHIVTISDLLLLTIGAVWKVTASNSDVLTPSNVSAKVAAKVGASNMQPAETGSAVLFSAVLGGHLHEVRYSWEANGYQVQDMSLIAPHLVDGYTLKNITYAHAPYRVAWSVRSDGALLGFTYVPEQQVAGWHQHTTQGAFEAVASIPEEGEHFVYAVVRRTVNGRTVRYIERMHSRRFAALEECFFVDAGATYRGALTDTIGDLWHLEACEVVALADGAVVKDLTVSGGEITLPFEASIVHIGLAFTADAKTLPLGLEAAGPSAGLGMLRSPTQVNLRVQDSSSIQAGASFDTLYTFKQRTDEAYGEPPRLFTGVADIRIDAPFDQDGAVCVQQVDPLPLTVLAMSLEVAVGG